jgi:hypothetical protein
MCSIYTPHQPLPDHHMLALKASSYTFNTAEFDQTLTYKYEPGCQHPCLRPPLLPKALQCCGLHCRRPCSHCHPQPLPVAGDTDQSRSCKHTQAIKHCGFDPSDIHSISRLQEARFNRQSYTADRTMQHTHKHTHTHTHRLTTTSAGSSLRTKGCWRWPVASSWAPAP